MCHLDVSGGSCVSGYQTRIIDMWLSSGRLFENLKYMRSTGIQSTAPLFSGTNHSVVQTKRHFYIFRWLILFGGGLIALFAAHLIHYDGAGGLATIIMAFVAGMQWRKEGWGDHNPVTKTFQRMWIILQPVIFALIGTEIQV